MADEINESEATETVSDEELTRAIEDGLSDAIPADAKSKEPVSEEEEAVGEPVAEEEPAGEEPAGEEPPKEEVKEEEKPPEEEEKPPPEKAEAKPSDEFGTLDKDVPEKTRQRFDAMKARYDEISEQRNAALEENISWRNAITGTGTNQEQFGMALDYLRAVNSQTREGQEQAYNIMLNELKVLSQSLGKPVPGIYDPLSEHSDLQQRVDEGVLSESDAFEIAEARAAKRHQETVQATNNQRTQEQQQVQEALDDIKALGETFRKTDPLFMAKMPFLKPIIESVAAAGGPPSGWKIAVEKAYRQLPANIGQQIETSPKPPTQNPLRPGPSGSSGAGLKKEPGSELEALDMALDRGF